MSKASMVLINGKIYSFTLGGDRISGSAVAVAGDKILAVGTDDEIKNYIDDSTEVIDCKGNTILPGLFDSHVHPTWTASLYNACHIFDVTSDGRSCDEIIEEYKDRMRNYIKENPDEEVYRGIGWVWPFFNGSSGEKRYPTRFDLDEVCSDKPMVLECYEQHNLWVNTKAIELAGIDENTETPSSGKIPRDEKGYPIGLFHEMPAMDLIKTGTPGWMYSVEKYKESLLQYQKIEANRYGTTFASDCLCSDNAREAYKQLAQSGELTMRFRGVYCVQPENAEEDLEAAIARKGMDDVNEYFAIPTIKLFLEGEYCMFEPWEPEILKLLGLPDGYAGTLPWSDELAEKCIKRALEAGFQLHLHALGDRAIAQAVNSLYKAEKAYPGSYRNVIAHLLAVRPEEMKKMGEMRTICTIQNRWMIYNTDIEDSMIPYYGKKRAEWFYPHKRYLDAGAIVTYGTDFPVTPPPNRFYDIQCALTRQVNPSDPDYERFKGKTLGPEENKTIDCPTLDDAIKSLTIFGAYQNFVEDLTGSLEVNKSADMAILDVDIESIPVSDIWKIEVDKTIFKGKVVYENER